MSNPELVKLYNKAIRALALRARSVAEIRAKLSAPPTPAKGKAHEVGMGFVDPDVVEQVIQKLISQNLLNDRQFASDYIRYQLSMRPLGERALSFRLGHLGVDASTIKETIREAFESPQTAIDLARRAIRSKNVSGLTPRKQAEKLSRFLASRGFSYSTIRVIIDDLLQKE